MRIRKRIYLLFAIMGFVAMLATATSSLILYNAAITEQRSNLGEIAKSQARLIEAVARFDEVTSPDFPGGYLQATLSQVRDAQEQLGGLGETGEFTLATRQDDMIVWLLRHRHGTNELPAPIPIEGELAEPMKLALSGQSGTMIGIDYRGERVLAAHEALQGLELGIVAKIDMEEVRAPFIRAGGIALVLSVVAILLGSNLFFRITIPIVREVEENEARLQLYFDSTSDLISLTGKDAKALWANRAWLRAFGNFLNDSKDPFDFVHPDDVERVAWAWESMVLDGSEIRNLEYRFQDDTGDYRTFETSVAAVGSGEDPQYYVFAHDISERKANEQLVLQRNKEMETILDVSRKVSSRADLDELLSAIPQAIVETLPAAEASSVWLYDDESDKLAVRAWHGHSGQELSSLELSQDDSLVGRVYRDQDSILIEDTRLDTTFRLAGKPQLDRTISVIGVPLLLEDRTIGALFADCFSRAHAFSTADLRWLESLANQIVHSVERSRLLSAEKRSKGELDRARAVVVALSRVAVQIGKETDPDRVMAQLGKELNQIHSEYLVVLLNDDDGSLLLQYTSIDPIMVDRLGSITEFPTIGSLLPDKWSMQIKELMRQETGTYYPNFGVALAALMSPGQERAHQRLSRLVEVGLERAVIAMPLIMDDRAQGLIVLWGPGLQEADIPAISIFASQVAGILENARLFQQVVEGRKMQERLSARVIEIQELERRAVALELHDQIMQLLAALKLNIEAAMHTTDPLNMDALKQSEIMADNAISKVRNLVLDLRPSVLDDFGLGPALRWYLDRQVQTHGIQLRSSIADLDVRPDPRVEIACFRVTQQAMSNAIRHADAPEIEVEMRALNGKIELYVHDNGCGFDVDQAQRRASRGESMGILSMADRVSICGGTLSIKSEPGEGTTIRAIFPYSLSDAP